MAEKLSPTEIDNHLKDLKGWMFEDTPSRIQKDFKFKDFRQAWAFMSACADYAEEINHHPEWFNVYNRVEVTLSTHDVGGLSDLDIKMATFMDGRV